MLSKHQNSQVSLQKHTVLSKESKQLKELNINCFSEAIIYLFGVLRRFQHCTGHITTGSWKGRGNQYI